MDDRPYFGWFVDDPDDHETQSAYQIIVASSLSNLNANHGDMWDSGKIKSRNQNYIYFDGVALSAANQYYWKVRTWDKRDEVGPYSASATMETGLFSNEDWVGAKWIRRNAKDADDYTFFRKKLTLEKKSIRRAVVYIAACHSYTLYVNGIFIGKGFDNQYPQYSYYNAWDIEKVLTENAENIFACMTHWYGGGQGRATGARGLLLKVVIEYSDGTNTILGSDGSWKQTQATQWVPGQPQRNGEGVGRIELFDSRKVTPDWNTLNFDDSFWQFADEIGNHPTAPWTSLLRPDLTRVIEEEIKPVSVNKQGNGNYVIDLGKIYSGSFKIEFKGGHEGDTIRMTGGFVLNNDGTVSRQFNQQTNLRFLFIQNGGNAVFCPEVYLGLRYLEVENAPNELTQENVGFVNRHFELDPTHSDFVSSDSMLNNVWALLIHSLMVGSQEGFVDTPTREKGTFLGDGWSQAVPALSTMYDRVMNHRVLNEFLDSQDQYWTDGRLNAVYPNVDGARDIPDYTQSYLVWVWDYYMQTGNKEFLRINFLRLKKIADYVTAYKNDKTGLIHKLEGGKGPYQYGIIDWPTSMRYGYDVAVDSRTVIDVYAFADFDILSKIARVLEYKEESEDYRTRANEIKKAINTQLINEEGVYIDGIKEDGTQSTHISQHANAFPMALDIVPEKIRGRVIAEVKKRKMNVGMVFLRWLPEAIGKADQGEHLIELYTNTNWDGFAKTIALGGTVTWESWDANISNESMSHPWGAVGLLAIQEYMLGIQPLKPQHDLVQIKPLDFGKKLSSVKGSYPTDKGNINISWSRSDSSYTLEIDIPDNIVAKVYIPKCGFDRNFVVFDGIKTKGKSEGNYLYLENIGSGKHTLKREGNK